MLLLERLLSPATKSNATVARVLDSARLLFLERNYADVTMSQIAAKAAVTKGALYHHFDSKEELYVRFLLEDLEQKRALHAQALLAGASARERLEFLTRAFLELPAERRDVISLVRRDINVFRGAVREELIRAYQHALPELVEEILRAGIERGELKPGDPRLLSWHFVAMVEVLLTPYADGALDTEAKLATVLNLFFGGAAA